MTNAGPRIVSRPRPRPDVGWMQWPDARDYETGTVVEFSGKLFRAAQRSHPLAGGRSFHENVWVRVWWPRRVWMRHRGCLPT